MSVNRRLREALSPSRSPSPNLSPSPIPSSHNERSRYRDRSRSPYRSGPRSSRGEKRPRESDHYNAPYRGNEYGRARDRDERRNTHERSSAYEHASGYHHGRGARTSYKDLDRASPPNVPSYYDRDEWNRLQGKKQRTHSRSPDRHDRRDNRPEGNSQKNLKDGQSQGRESSKRIRGNVKFVLESSASHTKGKSHANSSFSGDSSERKYKNGMTQSQVVEAGSTNDQSHSESITSAADDMSASNVTEAEREVISIEERRRRREEIKAKHRDQAKEQSTPLLVQALQHSSLHGSNIANSPDSEAPNSPAFPSSLTPQSNSYPGSPDSSSGLNDTSIDRNRSQTPASKGDETSAADYNPIMDMEDDHARRIDSNQSQELASSTYDETKDQKQDVLIPMLDAEETLVPKKSVVDDMFASDDDDDMFAGSPQKKVSLVDAPTKAVSVSKAKQLDQSLHDNWDDHEGYYKFIPDELIGGRYHTLANLGKGMFSNVFRATDMTTNELVAIKVIRNNETMVKAGRKEMDILQKLSDADASQKKHIVRLIRSFQHKNHLCMVFENLDINLREVLKKFGRTRGLHISGVRSYARQMFLGLDHLKKCNLMHADLKPDNILVTGDQKTLKICDLGSAADSSENEDTDLLVSRFYRAPEIILGLPYGFPMDMWSIGCTLFELYTGKILFTGQNNNQMLRSFMECRGAFSEKLLKKASRAELYFGYIASGGIVFKSLERDKISGKEMTKLLTFNKPTRDLKSRILAASGDGKGLTGLPPAEVKAINQFAELLDKCLKFDPEKRITPAAALKDEFFATQNKWQNKA